MKVKTSVTLSKTTLRAVDKLVGKRGNRSAFIEEAVREYVLQKHRELRDKRDLAVINNHADELNAFVEDVLQYQADPFEQGDE